MSLPLPATATDKANISTKTPFAGGFKWSDAESGEGVGASTRSLSLFPAVAAASAVLMSCCHRSWPCCYCSTCCSFSGRRCFAQFGYVFDRRRFFMARQHSFFFFFWWWLSSTGVSHTLMTLQICIANVQVEAEHEASLP